MAARFSARSAAAACSASYASWLLALERGMLDGVRWAAVRRAKPEGDAVVGAAHVFSLKIKLALNGR